MIINPNLQLYVTGQDNNDKSKNGFTGTNTTAASVAGIFGNAFYFDNTADALDFGNQTALNFERTDKFSISFWLKGTIPGSRNGIMGKYSGAPAGWTINNSGNPDGSGKIELFLVSGWGTNWLLARGGLMSTTFKHFCFTYNGTSARSGVLLYENGISQAIENVASTDNLSTSIQTAASFMLGTTNGTELMNQTVEDVQIYSYVLSSSDVLRIMNGLHPLTRS